jgi:hypothetical protein
MINNTLQACQHLTLDPGDDIPDSMPEDTGPDPNIDEQPPEKTSGPDLLTYLANCAESDTIPSAHLARMMSEAINRHTKDKKPSRKANVAMSNVTPSVVYSISRSAHVSTNGSALIDGGSNGGLAG